VEGLGFLEVIVYPSGERNHFLDLGGQALKAFGYQLG
jgi:hypothetical protein